MAWLRRLRSTIIGSHVDDEFDQEARFHLEERTEEYIRHGMTLEEARREARRRLGNLTLAREQAHDVDTLRWLEDLGEDLRYAARTLRKTPGFTAVAVLMLALGMGANTAIFSVVNTVLLNPIPYPDPSRLMMFVSISPQGSSAVTSPTKFNIWRAQTGAFQDVSAYRFNVANLTGGNDPEQIAVGQVSSDFFRLLGAPVVAGRTFSAEEDRPDGGNVVVLSEGLWTRRFGRDPHIAGRSLALNGEPHVIVGILGQFDTEAIQSPTGAPDVWIPFQIDPNSTNQGQYFQAAGRLKAGVTLGMANAQLQLAANEFRQKFPRWMSPQNGFSARPLQEVIVSDARPSLLVLLGAVSFVLLIACANVANLLLVRATARRREIAIRTAIGAARGRIVRQLLTEGVVIAMLGGSLGLALGMVGIRALLAINPSNIPRIGPNGSLVTVDWRVLAFTGITSVLTALAFGLFPALRASRADLSAALNESRGRSGIGVRQNKARALLVVAETGLALVLLVGASLLIRTFVALRAVNPGFSAHQVLTLRMSLTGSRFTKTAGVTQLIRDGVVRLNNIPGVDVVGVTCCVPLEDPPMLPFVMDRSLGNRWPAAGGWMAISAGYLDAFRIPLIRGRRFTDRDDAAAPGVVIINQAMARRYWPIGDPLRDRLIIGGKAVGPQFDEPARQIVGIVGDTRDAGLNRDSQPAMYVPWMQLRDELNALNNGLRAMAWVVRTRVEPHAVSRAIQDELRPVSGGLPVARVRTMDELVGQSTARADFSMVLLTLFGCAALCLAAIGLYGVTAYAVQQRTHEIGIRLALGADSNQVRNMVLVQGMTLAVLGLAIGAASAFGLAHVLASFLFGVTPHDGLAFIIAPVVLGMAAFAAVWFPACRATLVDPMMALRHE
jgi:putative ABC transport system permease protein